MGVEDEFSQGSNGSADTSSLEPLRLDNNSQEVKRVRSPEGREVEIDPHIWALMHILDLVEPRIDPDIPQDTSDTSNDLIDINELMRFAGVDVDEIEVRTILSGMGFSTLRELSVTNPQSPATMNQLEVQHNRDQDVYKRPQNWGEIKETALKKVADHLQEKGIPREVVSDGMIMRTIRSLVTSQLQMDSFEEIQFF